MRIAFGLTLRSYSLIGVGRQLKSDGIALEHIYCWLFTFIAVWIPMAKFNVMDLDKMCMIKYFTLGSD